MNQNQVPIMMLYIVKVSSQFLLAGGYIASIYFCWSPQHRKYVCRAHKLSVKCKTYKI